MKSRTSSIYLLIANVKNWRLFILIGINAMFALALHAQQSQSHLYAYLKINIYEQDSSRLILKETYTRDKSGDAAYRKRFLSSREEYDDAGRPSLHLFYDHEGEMQSKIITYYPHPHGEKGVFQQRNGFIDSVLYLYNDQRQRVLETWAWGEDCSHDTVRYRYNAKQQLISIGINYLGKFKRDTLLYKNNLLDRAVTYNENEELQGEVEFFYLETTLLKVTRRNAKRLIVEEEFFYYNINGDIAKTIIKLYPQGGEDIYPPYIMRKNSYYRNGTLKQCEQTSYNKERQKTGSTLTRYNRAGRLVYQYERSKPAQIDKKMWFDYTVRPANAAE